MAFKIQKDVPPPPPGRQAKWPFTKMVVGDSVFFKGEDIDGNALRAARAVGLRHKKVFTARRERDGIRIWRTE